MSAGSITIIGDEYREPIPGPSPEEQHSAVLTICANAIDAADARQLLTMVGLL